MFKLDLDELTEANIKERYEAYKLSLDSGIESVNEIRRKENLESVDGLDIHKMTIGQALYNSSDGSWFVPNTGVQIDDKGVSTINGEAKSVDNKQDTTQQDNTKEKETEDTTTNKQI